MAVAPGGDEPEGQADTLSAETWQRLCAAGDRYRQGEAGTWEVLVAVSDFVKVSGEIGKAFNFMSTLPRPPSR